MTPLWLTLARIGEQSPHAAESSFTAGQRTKWVLVAQKITRTLSLSFSATDDFEVQNQFTRRFVKSMCSTHPDRPPLSASGTSEMSPEKRERIERTESVADTIDDGIIRVGDVVYNCKRCGRSPKADQKDPMRCRACGHRADTIDEQGEADEASRTPIGSQPIGSRHATDAVIGEAARGKDNEPATGARTGDRVDSLASASPSLPPWPIVVGGSYENGVLRTAMFKIEEIEHWRDAACLEIKRLQAIIDAAKEALC